MRNLDVPTHPLEKHKRYITVAGTNVFGEKKGNSSCASALQFRAEGFCIRNKGNYNSLIKLLRNA